MGARAPRWSALLAAASNTLCALEAREPMSADVPEMPWRRRRSTAAARRELRAQRRARRGVPSLCMVSNSGAGSGDHLDRADRDHGRVARGPGSVLAGSLLGSGPGPSPAAPGKTEGRVGHTRPSAPHRVSCANALPVPDPRPLQVPPHFRPPTNDLALTKRTIEAGLV